MLSLMLSLVMMSVPAPAAAQEPAATVPVVTTIGEGVVRRAPDRAVVTLSVESRAQNPRDAQRQTAEAMAAVQKRLGELRLGADAIRTTGYDVEQEFDFEGSRRTSRGYVARNAIEVTLDEVARTGEVIDLAVRAGATGVGGVRFDLRDRESAEREALRLAVADARARAEAAASGAGRTIDRVLRIEDARRGASVPPQPMFAARAAGPAAAEPPIVPGLIEIRESVSLTASMK